MSTASDRRSPDATRIPFDGMVEVGGALGPSFEAQAVNLSEDGMHLRTTYLPEVGQPVTCRFDAGQGLAVTAAGEVLWKDDMGNGGEFGIRFTNLDSASTVALQRIVGMVEDGQAIAPPHGRKVRLHIDGLASPMRARVKGEHGQSVTAFSELGFLQVGKQLDLEDAQTGSKRPALIDRVAVDLEPQTRIPQLVVTLRYDDEEAYAAERAEHEAAAHHDGMLPGGSLAPHAMDHGYHADENDDIPDDEVPGDHHHDGGHIAHASAALEGETTEDEEHHKMKGAFARSAAKVTPALEKWAKRAKTTVALLAARARQKSGAPTDDVEIPVRRKTAPAPGGGLTTSGRKVIRGEIEDTLVEEEPSVKTPLFAVTKKKAVVGAAIGATLILAMVAMRKPAPAPVVSAAPAAD
ncbi:MAG: hypothetical protein JWP97_59, partial [Labilithrix sp.]|nr:hypothetical protein [Labilithrix sp.]